MIVQTNPENYCISVC